MEKFPQNPAEKEQPLDVMALFEKAKTSAPRKSDYEAARKREIDLSAKYIKGEIGVAEFKLENNNEGVILMNNISDFKKVLEALNPGDKNKIESTLAHENDHMVQALSLGLSAQYGTRLVVPDDADEYDYQPFVSVEIPAGTSQEEGAKALQQIIAAPEELSGDDKAQLDLRE
jgi:hypothetical protein